MTARTLGVGGIAAVTTCLASSLLHAAPEDLPPEDRVPSWLISLFFSPPKILDQLPIYVAVLCLGVVILLHWLRTRSVARRWRGEHAGWATLWLLPCIVGLVLYASLLLGVLLWELHKSLVFQNYFVTQFFMERKLLWLLGWLIAVFPGIAILFIPGRRGALGLQGEST